MIRVGTLREAAARRTSYHLNGQLLADKSIIIGASNPDDSIPNAFLVEQAAFQDLPAHFHGYGQFQVVVAGGGKLGGHELRPLTVHYAGQRTTYGPIKPGAEGLSYLTLRPRTEVATFFMPQSRHLRDPAIARFELYSEPQTIAGPAGGVKRLEPRVDTLLAPTTQGLAAWLMRLPDGCIATAPALCGGAGRFYVVVGGALQLDEGIAGWLTTIWADADEPPMQFTPGREGAEVIVLQFPSNACEHPLPPSPWAATPTDLNIALNGA